MKRGNTQCDAKIIWERGRLHRMLQIQLVEVKIGLVGRRYLSSLDAMRNQRLLYRHPQSNEPKWYISVSLWFIWNLCQKYSKRTSKARKGPRDVLTRTNNTSSGGVTQVKIKNMLEAFTIDL